MMRWLERILSILCVPGKPFDLDGRIRHLDASATADAGEHLSLGHAEIDEYAPCDEPGPADACTTMNSDGFSAEKVGFNGPDQPRNLKQRVRDTPIRDGK